MRDSPACATPRPRIILAGQPWPGASGIDPETGEVLEPGEYPSGPRTLYVISPFIWQEAGEAVGFVKLPDLAQHTETAALAEAEMMVALGKWAGAIVVRQTSDPEAGEYGEPEVLAMIGRLPEEE